MPLNPEDIKRMLTEAGASACGIAEALPVDDGASELYDRWISTGRHADMDYLAKYPDVRRDPRLLLEGARSIIVAAFNYFTPRNQGDGALRWARYSLGRDYHEELRERLGRVAEAITGATGAACRVTVDTAPLRERYWAVRAGVGFIGINNQLIVPSAGSWCLLGEIITTLPLTPDEPCRESCAECMRCVKACPGHALDGCGSLDARKCMSYLTIEKKYDPSAVDADVMPPVGNRIYGCDICQEVCPHNRGVSPSEIPAFAPRESILSLSREDIITMEQGDFSRIFTHSAIKRAKLAGLQRNARSTEETKERKDEI